MHAASLTQIIVGAWPGYALTALIALVIYIDRARRK